MQLIIMRLIIQTMLQLDKIMTERPLILISNDDGYSAKGIGVLMNVLTEFGDVVVVAPHTGRSGKGCAITSENPIKYWEVKNTPHLKVYACTGTPVDCVKLAFHTILERRPALVVGGINHGDNSAVNAHYSAYFVIEIIFSVLQQQKI